MTAELVAYHAKLRDTDRVKNPGVVARTPMAFVLSIVEAYRRDGRSPAQALQKAQIAPALLDDPDARITAQQLETLSAWAMQELDDEALGWFSRKLPWGTYGMLCRASLTSPTLGVALHRWCRHHRLLTDDIVLTLEHDGHVATLSIEERRPLGTLREFCLLTSLRYVHGYASWLMDSRLTLQAVDFPFTAPAHADVYPLLFPGPVGFGAEAAAFRFDTRYLSLPIHRDENALKRMLRHALRLTVHQYRRDRLLTQRLRQALIERPELSANADAVAEHLHLSVRTLHRQLNEEGTSLQSLKDEVRRELALRLLSRTARPIKQVAIDCGFRNDKSFTRAFRAWTGVTPSQWRDQAADSGPS